MGVPDAPGWLVPAFVRSALALGATATREEIEATGSALLARWSDPQRHFHGLKHLVHVLERADSLSQEVHNPEMVRVAAWYHGAVFDATVHKVYKRAAGENKALSAALAEEELLELGISPKVAGRVRDLILSLERHDADPTDVDAMALCDADLGTLAVEPQKYREYRKRVREEFSLVSDRDYISARIQIITKLLARRQIFLSPHAAAWEGAARQNLEAELMRLRAELEALGEAADEPSHETGAVVGAAGDGTDAEAGTAEAPSAMSEAARARTAAAPDAAAAPREARDARVQAERFSPDTSYTADDTTVLGMEPAARKERQAQNEDREAPECIGVPFEEREAAERRTDSRLLSNMEKEPIDPSSLPRRVSVEDARKKADAARDAAPTGSAHDDESTGTLFRPMDL